MQSTHRARVEALLRDAAEEHARLMPRLAPELRDSLPVDAQGLTRAIDYLAAAAGLSEDERRELVRSHALNPAVLHARIFGPAPLTRETVIGSFVEGARVRAEALSQLADRVGGTGLGHSIRALLLAHPLPGDVGGEEAIGALRESYAAQERAALLIAADLDAEGSSIS